LKNTKFFKNILAVDFDEDCCRACNDLGLDVEQGSVDVLADNSVDLMVMNDMIEHLFDPTEFLLQCNKKLTNNGYIAIACPNGQGFDFQLMKEKTVNICPPEHLNYFNVHSLPLLLGSAGFNVVSAETPGILDADIVKRGLEDGSFCMDDNMFLKNLLLSSSEETLTCFQEFLSTNKLSSHMLVIANKTISQGRN
jgi:2-polyprenyl-3-methyl-5-hydroxy-6-metoxy-1,4-benzoquinol methylase